MFLTLINRAAGFIPPLAYAAAVVLLMLGLGVQSKRPSGALTDAAESRAGLLTCSRVNVANLDTVEQLTGANAACLAGRRIDATRYAVAVAGWSETERRLNNEAEQLKKDRERIYENEECKTLRAVNISIICPAIADSLRDHADSYYRD
jgi:hypothetical protein